MGQNTVKSPENKSGGKEKKQPLLWKANKKGQHISGWLNFLRILILPLVRLFYPFRYYGDRNVKDGACLYVCNHYRMIDPMYMLPTTWEGIHFIGKKESFSMPILGWFCKKVRMIAVSRDGTDVRAVMDSLKCLKSGEKIAIFPEGTRNKSDEPFLPFASGAAVLAIRAKAPIVPVVIYEKAKLFKTTHVLIGEPFELSEYYGQKLTDELLKEADEKIKNALVRMREDHAQMLQSKKRKK